ncbi:MAG: acyl--CoA ligase, partial [Clostridia bacterium]|nr:acyl--CoA ligase [Clostridia bacterium]
MEAEKKLTGYPSIDKPWLKYYTDEAINAPLPECTIFEYMYENNKEYPDDIALLYFNSKITYGELFRNIDKTAKAFTTIGVKKGDIVTVAMPSMPEALYCVYALNRLGAVANMIHPLASENEICHYLNEVKSTVFVMFTGTYELIKNALDKTSVKKAVVASP